jgi:hypothetical protein
LPLLRFLHTLLGGGSLADGNLIEGAPFRFHPDV